MGNSKSSAKNDKEPEIKEKNKITLYPKETVHASEEVDQCEEKQVYGKKELEEQIRKIDHELNIVRKLHACDKNKPKLAEARDAWHQARYNFTRGNYCVVETYLSDSYEKLIEVVNDLSRWRKLQYFTSSWGLSPITLGLAGIIFSLVMLYVFEDQLFLNMVPFWAIWVASLGASTQILVGVAMDYKKDGIISDYRRTWYTVIIFVSLAFGFIAFLFLQTGLLTMSQGQFVINPTNVTSQTPTNLTATPTPTSVVSASTGSLALPVLICFLAGYATEWFITLIGKLTSSK